MLPVRAAETTENVDRARLENLRQRFAAFRSAFFHRPRTELHPAFRQQRDAGDDVKRPRIAVPANRGARRIVGHKHFGELFRVAPRELSDASPQRQ